MITKHEVRFSGGSGVVCIEQKYHSWLFSLKDKHSFVVFEKKKESVYEESPKMLKSFEEEEKCNILVLLNAKVTIVGLSDKCCGSSHNKVSGNPCLNSCKSLLMFSSSFHFIFFSPFIINIATIYAHAIPLHPHIPSPLPSTPPLTLPPPPNNLLYIIVHPVISQDTL